MLFLRPPFHIIEGVAVFPDHENGRQFYYMPAMPHLTTVRDDALQIDRPRISLLEFRQVDAKGGGFLTFEVNLGIGDDKKDEIKAQLRQIHQLDDEAILSPVVLENGTVRLMILGRMSAQPPADGQPPASGDDEEPRFVVRISPPFESKPSLYGDNQAVFSVELDEEGVQLIEASLTQAEVQPIGIVYSLDFLALRPAFTVKVEADWKRVQTHFEESFGIDSIIASVDIDKQIDKLIEDRVVKIEVDSFLPEGEDAGSWVGRRDQALNDFKDMVIERFFEPSIEPMKKEQDGWDKFLHTTERLSALAATGGWGGIAKFTYTKRDLTRIDEKRINLTMNERVTVRRSIYPQAALSGLAGPLRDLIAQGKGNLSDFIQLVTLDNDWFKKREVTAHSIVDFDYENVDSITVTLNYGNEPQTLRLTKEQPSGSRKWNSIVVDNELKREVDYQYRVDFKGVDTAERPGMVTSPKLVTAGNEFNIAPRNERLYFVDEITFGASLLPWDRYPNVNVEVAYEDGEHDISLAETFVLSKDHPEATWKRFRLDPDRDDYQLRVTFFASDHRNIVGDWITTQEEKYVISDPRPGRRTVEVVPAVAWGLVTMVFVELEYLDEANSVHDRQTLSFFNTDQDRGTKTATFNLVDPEQRFVYYSGTILLSDNRLITVPRSVTTAQSIFVHTDMLGHRIVAVQPADGDFHARGIVRIEADLSFADATAGLNFADRFAFLSSKDVMFFEYDFAAAERNSYTCMMRTVLSNGLVQERDLGSLDGDKLILPAA